LTAYILEENANMSKRKILTILGVVLGMGLVLAACSTPPSATPCPTCPTQAPPKPCPTAAACPAAPAPVLGAFEKLFATAGHADKKSEAWMHWDAANPAEIPTSCAQCHSPIGFQDFLGVDGSTVRKVDKAVPVKAGTNSLTCEACHNTKTADLSSVLFPSGIEIKGLGKEAICMTCHDGRAAKKTIDDKIAQFKVTDLDKVVEPLKNADGSTTAFSFANPHYFAAALTLYGTDVKGGYEYAGKIYDAKFQHVVGYDSCVDCHNPHSLELEVAKCTTCHTAAKTVDDLKKIRMVSSVNDFNGNGDVKEGMSAEVTGVQAVLLKAIYAYAKDVIKVGIVYDGATNPYYFQDKDNDGKIDVDDKKANISYTSFTGRLLQAAYNYQVVAKDPGAYAHNGKYAIELMYDSIADLNTKLPTKIDISKLHRDDVGHFAGNGEPFRHWDSTALVPAGCARCHSSDGLPQFIANGGKLVVSAAGTLEMTGVVAQPPANGFLCSTCHTSKMPEVLSVVNVPFPNGKTLTFSTKKDDKGALLPVSANLCLECHQGVLSTATMNNFLAAYPDQNKPDAAIGFKNVHYFTAGATLFGNMANGMYEYAGKTYVGRFMHVDGFQTCTDCHDKHTLEVKVASCTACHPVAKTAADLSKIRMTKDDYSGSKDAAEPMEKVIETFQTRLYAAVQKYAKEIAGLGLVYDPASYPYFFADKDGDGKGDKNATGGNVSFNAFTPNLLKAAYNLQYSYKDPGAFAHNAKYVLQVIYDAIQNLGGDLTGLTRPQ
jgi:hypothetical protein